MNSNDLIALIGQYEKSALGSNVSVGPAVGGQIKPANSDMTTLEIDRYNALNAYFGRPMGNEVDGRSQIVLPELRDTIEWVMPQLMRMFAATSKVCQFDAVNPQDEQQAEIETEVVNAIFMKDNQGFFVLHDFFKDALLLRNGYAKVWWEEKEESTVESYTGLDEMELTELLTPDEPGVDIEVLEQEEKIDIQQTPMGEIQTSTFDVKIRRNQKKGEVKVECIPPEEILVSPQARHKMDDCPFIEHKTQVSRSDLIEQGFDEAVVNSIAISRPNWLNLISIARDEVVDQLSEDVPSDKASELVDFREILIRVDFNDDGRAELRRVFMGGDKILSNEEVAENNFSYCSPIRMPHRHVGISYYDLLNDLQVIKTTLFRQALDNLYISNNQRTAVNWRTVNIDDLLTSRPGGVVRVDGAPAEHIMPMSNDGLMMQQVIPAMEYVDNLREMRTGIGKDTMGVDADALQDVTKGGQLAAMSAAALKVELVARLLAEGVKDLFLKIHSTLIRHQDKPMTINIAGKWVDVNPANWRKRSAVSVNVGLGSGNREEARSNLMMMIQLQQQIGQFGLVGPKQAYETFKQAAHLLGFENPDLFAVDPDSPQAQQLMQQHASMNPQAMKMQAEMQLEQQKLQMQGALKQQEMQQKAEIRGAELNSEMQKMQAQAIEDMKAKVVETQQSALLEQQRMQLDQWKAKLDNETKLLVAQIQAAAKGEAIPTSIASEPEAPKIDQNVIMAQALVDAVNGFKEAIGQLSRPKQVIRDANGRVVGVQ